MQYDLTTYFSLSLRVTVRFLTFLKNAQVINGILFIQNRK